MRLRKRILTLMLAAAMLVVAMPAGIALADTQNGQASGTVYEVKSFADLSYLVSLSKNKNKTFEGDTIELLADIELTQENRDAINDSPLSFGSYAAVGSSVPFSGTFNGNGHTISGLNYKGTASVALSTALFSYTKGATIRDLIIKDSHLDADMLGGILVGYAEDTTVVNSAVSGCDLSVNCVDNVLTLITDGGMVGGGLIGKASGCTLYNCEVSGTYVHTSATAGVQALGGKGLYMGAMVGSASNTTIEYSRVINGSRVKNSYDIAVGALGGNKVYAGGIAGEIKGGTKVIDSFSTAELYTYCATYVSVGAGNIGYVGGIAAASYGNDNEITRCHYAGNATSKQYNAAIVIPIIQKNKNVSGIAERIKDGELSVTGSYFRPSDSPETSMGVLDDTDSTVEYGPQDDATYADRSFWAGHGFDFSGTVSRSSSYSDDHANKWVMDYKLGIPVHGQSVSAAFDFPGAGSVTVGATDLVTSEVSTDEAYDFAVQGFKPTTTSYSVDLTAKTNDNFRFVEWYRVNDVTADSSPQGHGYFAALMEKGSVVSESSAYSAAECVDNDLFLAHMEAQVLFHDINGDVIGTDGTDSDDTSDDWYDFEQALPDVVPTHVPGSANARLIGWTTVKSGEAGGGYSSITNSELTQLRLAGNFYEAGDPVEKPMELYPVYADLVSNVVTIHEGNEQDESDDESLRLGVGKTWVTMDANNVATIHVGGVDSTDGDLKTFPEGYRFLGWYTDDGNGNQVRVSQDQEYTLNGVDLTTEHTYTARFEYRVQFWLPQRAERYGNYSIEFYNSLDEVWLPYNDAVFSSEWESEYTKGLEIATTRRNWSLLIWTADTSVLGRTYTASEYGKLAANPPAKYVYNSGVVSPLKLSGILKQGDNENQHCYYLMTDFPGSGDSAVTRADNLDSNLDVQVTLNSGYNFVFYDMIGKSTIEDTSKSDSLAHGKYAIKNSIDAVRDKNLSFTTPNQVTWDSDEYLAGTGNYTYYFTAHVTADVNFHKSDGTLIGSETLTTGDYPYQSADKTVTMTRRYQHKLFGAVDTSYATYDGGENPTAVSKSFATSDRGKAPDDPTISGYYFVGWVEPSQMADYERAYAFDVSNGTSVDGAPQYVSSSVDKAKAYTLQSDALVEHAMELYPVYVQMGKVATTTNLSAAASPSLNVPDDPTYTVTATEKDGMQTIQLQADVNEPLPGGSGTYELLRMTVSVDGGDEIDLTGDLAKGTYTYTPVEPGHSYLFTAYYRPYAVVFHKNGTTDKVVQVYNQYDPIRDAPLPTVQDSTPKLNDYLFVGWTEQVPENGLYLTYDAGADETVTYDKLDAAYRFVGNGTSVSHAMELWPVYAKIRVDVNSNIDAELTDKGIDLGTVRKVDRYAADGLQTKAVAMEVEGYRFVGWYKGIPADKLTDSTQYTSDKLVSTDSGYRLTGDSPYETTVYTARYLKVCKVVYHDQDGNVLATDYVYEDDDHPFERQETVTDADGKPITDSDGKEVTVSVPYFPDATSALLDGMTDRQVFETWLWIKSDGTQVEYKDFCESNIISDCIHNDGSDSREMHLYPVVWTMSATDSKGAAYEDMLFGGTFDGDSDSVSAYFSGDEPYLQPSITVHVEKTEWSGNGGEVSVSSVGQEGIPVTLYPDDDSAAKLMGTERTNAYGNAEFSVTAALTIEKKGGAELAGQSFLFTVKNNDSGAEVEVPVACEATEDGTAAGSVTLLLPAGTYSVVEDGGWACRYDAKYTVSYEASTASVDGYTENTAVAVSPIGCTGAKVACENTEKGDLPAWLFDGAHKENNFD